MVAELSSTTPEDHRLKASPVYRELASHQQTGLGGLFWGWGLNLAIAHRHSSLQPFAIPIM